MAVLRNATLVLIACLGLAGPALAADRLPPPPPLPADPPASIGWYVRGDVGYAMPRDPSGTLMFQNRLLPYSNARMGKSATFGLGVGAQFNSWFRADLTGTYATESRIRGNASADYAISFQDDAATLTLGTVLLNGYLDLGTWSGFTPYLGVGVGAAGLNVSNAVSRTMVLPGATLGAYYQIPSREQVNVAWAVMAGTSIDISRAVKLDLGYRYTALGKAASEIDTFGTQIQVKSLGTSEFRLGLRYMLSDLFR